jgi:hypothetical protein
MIAFIDHQKKAIEKPFLKVERSHLSINGPLDQHQFCPAYFDRHHISLVFV